MKIRKAIIEDLVAIVSMLADDTLGSQREDFKVPLPASYLNTFEAIVSDPNQELMVVEDQKGKVIGTFQLTFIPYFKSFSSPC